MILKACVLYSSRRGLAGSMLAILSAGMAVARSATAENGEDHEEDGCNVVDAYTIEFAAHHSQCPSGKHQPQHNTQERSSHHRAADLQHCLADARFQGHADTHLACSLYDHVGLCFAKTPAGFGINDIAAVVPFPFCYNCASCFDISNSASQRWFAFFARDRVSSLRIWHCVSN